MKKEYNQNQFLTYFPEEQIRGIDLPKKFTFPFYYQPHQLTKVAVKELQEYLETQANLEHNFGLNPEQNGLVIGKMFGVLVVQDKVGKLGYLSAFSGKLAGTNNHQKFVPPVFDMLTENSFFLREEEILNRINKQIEIIETNQEYINLKSDFKKALTDSQEEITTFKKQLKQNKTERKQLREANKNYLSETGYQSFEDDLIKQSLRDKYELRVLENRWKQALEDLKLKIEFYENQIENLKKERKEKSALLQQQLFEQYSFLNQYGKTKSLGAIFSQTVFGKPPAGAGECATPKLLHYAFANNLKPLAMAEFWWGTSPKSEIRKHRQFYPACTGKCEPILKHMLDGIETEENPFLKNFAANKKLKIIYEDDCLVVVNKPFDLLSVEGINVKDSVYTRLKIILKTEPLMVHRLDMATSGLLAVAKTKEAHKLIQKQFLKRTVKKRYTALLNGTVENDKGKINLPLRGDLDDRPRQLVCFEFGKKAITEYEIIERKNNITKVYFYPITGRTHQLRMHASHPSGLNAPIVGDDLYGTSSDRLYLHASHLEFIHPKTKEVMRFESKEEF
ncbi:MAG: RluA family pseudouridine synthase [Flavobacteriaceae bacterium]